MAANEFELIQRIARLAGAPPGVPVGIGDDAAVLRVPAGHDLVVAVDTLVGGVHFLPQAAPADIGYKALAVNLSDLAAMGAEPDWYTLALTLPAPDLDWVEAFAGGMLELAREFGLRLVGGDTTRGPLSVSIQIGGWVAPGTALLRSGARPGDRVFVSGTLGDAALGLAVQQGRTELGPPHAEAVLQRLNRPTPRVRLGLAARGVASAAIDVSDGLAADLGHLLEASRVGATVRVDALPRSPALQASPLAEEARRRLALSGGDDYELCLCVAPAQVQALRRACRQAGCDCAEIGVIEAQPGLRLRQADGSALDLPAGGYDHFRT